jgi:hypothetical protein
VVSNVTAYVCASYLWVWSQRITWPNILLEKSWKISPVRYTRFVRNFRDKIRGEDTNGGEKKMQITVYQSQWTPHIKEYGSTRISRTSETWSAAKQGE